ncbi:MAG: hypothetical protein KTR32_02270 [Granulosicoccus sp.]|nr:hypothetical protein [Granulosicoccus sp.]
MARNNLLGLLFCCLLLTVIAVPTVHGHAGERGFIMLLPTTEWIVTGTMLVIVTFVLLLFFPGKWLSGIAQKHHYAWTLPFPGFSRTLRVAFFLLYLLFMSAGWFGSSDPLVNPIGPVMWSWFWIGLVFLHLAFGNLWQFINPFDGADWALTKMLPQRSQAEFTKWPEFLQYWPAITLLLLLTWFENVSLSPYDPQTLCYAMLGYLILNVLAMRRYGRDQWLKYGEVFSVYFRMISWLAPVNWDFTRERIRVVLRWPYSGLLTVGTLSVSETIFVLVALACVTFDGASHTYWWLSLWHINPLEFGGRSTVYWQNTFGLLAASGFLLLLYFLTTLVFTNLSMSGVRGFRALAVSLVPIAFGYHLAHYLPAFTLESQYALRAISDPFALGWDLFGTANRAIIASVRSDFAAITTIWTIQMTAIILSHVISVVVAHVILSRMYAGAYLPFYKQLPYAGLMIAYTFVGLWLLSTASL